MLVRFSKRFWIILLLPVILVGILLGESKKDRELIRQMGHKRYRLREEAEAKLLERGEAALPELREVAENARDLEIRHRAQTLVLKIARTLGKSKSTGMELVVIPAGEFDMGSPPQESGRRTDEAQHRVRITSLFLLGKFEVTQTEFEQVMKFNPSSFAKTGDKQKSVRKLSTTRFPVDSVSWFDAIEFCNRLSKLDGYKPYYKVENVELKGKSILKAKVTVVGGNGYRLPTEAEWEHACRGQTSTPFHYGRKNTGKEANLKATVSSGGYGTFSRWKDLKRTTTVGSYPKNGWGLYDVHGNVAEWCQDWYDRAYYLNSPVNDPSGPKEGSQRSVRGGSWLVNERSCRSASRLMLAPDLPTYYTGFRVARTP